MWNSIFDWVRCFSISLIYFIPMFHFYTPPWKHEKTLVFWSLWSVCKFINQEKRVKFVDLVVLLIENKLYRKNIRLFFQDCVPIWAQCSISIPPEASNQRFSNVFKGYRNEELGSDWSICVKEITIKKIFGVVSNIRLWCFSKSTYEAFKFWS